MLIVLTAVLPSEQSFSNLILSELAVLFLISVTVPFELVSKPIPATWSEAQEAKREEASLVPDGMIWFLAPGQLTMILGIWDRSIIIFVYAWPDPAASACPRTTIRPVSPIIISQLAQLSKSQCLTRMRQTNEAKRSRWVGAVLRSVAQKQNQEEAESKVASKLQTTTARRGEERRGTEHQERSPERWPAAAWWSTSCWHASRRTWRRSAWTSSSADTPRSSTPSPPWRPSTGNALYTASPW